MGNYKINEAADEDLDRLFVHGVLEFGEKQADLYYDSLITRFDEIAEQPLLYQAVDHIRAGYRRSVCGAHAIYYRIDSDMIEIMRILGREDVGKRLR